MRKFLLLLLAVAYTIGFDAQTIDGLGKIHLGMTLKDVRAVFPKSLAKVQTSSKVKKVYKINAYTPIKNHTCKDIRLYFYNDTLYTMYVNNAPLNLRESLALKYGEPQRQTVRFRSYVEELAIVYQDDSPDFLNENKIRKWDIVDTYCKWNGDNPFAQCYYWELLYEDGSKGAAMDCVFYVKNLVLAKCVELEEKALELEGQEEKKKELDGL